METITCGFAKNVCAVVFEQHDRRYERNKIKVKGGRESNTKAAEGYMRPFRNKIETFLEVSINTLCRFFVCTSLCKVI